MEGNDQGEARLGWGRLFKARYGKAIIEARIG
jgi:hypothetical protein